MKYLYQFAVILAVTCGGELLRVILPLPVPASIYGLILLFVLLCTKIVRVEAIKGASDFLIRIMPVMFLPAAVGIINVWSAISGIVLPLLAVTAAVTVIVMAVTGCAA